MLFGVFVTLAALILSPEQAPAGGSLLRYNNEHHGRHVVLAGHHERSVGVRLEDGRDAGAAEDHNRDARVAVGHDREGGVAGRDDPTPTVTKARDRRAGFVRSDEGLRHLDAAPASDSGGLYSLRARRRFAAYLRMRLLEMRKAGLERAALVVEKRLPIESLMSPP